MDARGSLPKDLVVYRLPVCLLAYVLPAQVNLNIHLPISLETSDVPHHVLLRLIHRVHLRRDNATAPALNLLSLVAVSYTHLTLPTKRIV